MKDAYESQFKKIIKDFESILQRVNPMDTKTLLLLIGHLKLLTKYMKTDCSSWSSTADYYRDYSRVLSQLVILKNCLLNLIPDYKGTVNSEFKMIMGKIGSPNDKGIYGFLEHCFDLLEIQNVGEIEIEGGNIYLGVEEKLKRANKSLKDGNIEGLFSNLHTIVEIILKDKLGIALDMDGAKLGKVLGICIRHEVFKGKNNILSQLDKNICKVDNNLKHKGFNPSANQINDAMLIGIQTHRVLKNESPNISEEVKEEINSILIKNN